MPVHRDLFAVLSNADLTPSELKVALGVIRASWGWGKTTTEHRFSHPTIEALTGIRDRKQRKRALDGLQAKGVIILVEPANPATCSPAVWALVKDYDTWACAPLGCPIWRQAPPGSHPSGVPHPPGSSDPGEGEPPTPPGSRTPHPSGVPHPPHEAQVEAQVEAQDPPHPPGGDSLFSPAPSPKPDPVLSVWRGYVEGRSHQRSKPGTDARRLIKARLKEHSVEDLVLVSRWMLQAPDDYCRRQRESGYTTYTTLFKASGMQDRVDRARAWERSGRPNVTAEQDAKWEAWLREPGGECSAARADLAALKAMGRAPDDVALWLSKRSGAPPAEWLRGRLS